MLLTIELLTPERKVFEKTADIITAPTPMGEISILPEHQNLVTLLSPGVIELKSNVEGRVVIETLSTTGGVLEVQHPNHILILSDAAERAEEIDLKRAEEARERAKKIMDQAFTDDVKYTDALGALERSIARLRVARRHRSHKSTLPQE